MSVTIRQWEGSPGEYFAGAVSPAGKATDLAYFHDDIFGAVALLNFVEMLRRQCAAHSVEVKLLDSRIRPKNPARVEVLRQ